jgi:hypothetical protein
MYSSSATGIQQRKRKCFSIRSIILEELVEVFIGPEQEVACGSSFVLRRSSMCEKIQGFFSLLYLPSPDEVAP